MFIIETVVEQDKKLRIFEFGISIFEMDTTSLKPEPQGTGM